MKQNLLIGGRLAFGLIVLSFVFAACSTSEQNANANRVYKTSEMQGAQYSTTMNSNAMTMNNASMNSSLELTGKSVAAEDRKTDGERYASIEENPFLETSRAPLSTFSIDVDTASYANVRRHLNEGQLPPRDAVRIEELINYFEYDYPQPIGNVPFSVNTEVATTPWNQQHKIVSIGLQGKKVSMEDAPPSNLVFLVDVSGSMNTPDRLPLVKQGLRFLANQLSAKDRVAIVVYAGTSGLVLNSTNNRAEILNALERLEAGGSTDGGHGIQLAYQVALDNFIKDGNNRVVLATDGDFNVGLTNDNELVNLIETKRRTGVFLSVLGFGTGNTNDSMMEKLADKGNGNYAYIDSPSEAKKALGEQAAGTHYTIAKDVKIQVEFNPAKVAGYRLIGYENRLLADKDFNNDKKDAGEIGAGHSVTALYEIIPAGLKVENEGEDELRYARTPPSETKFNDELLTVKLRYKETSDDDSKLLTQGLLDAVNSIENASENLRFSSAIAEFGLLLRNSRYRGNSNYEQLTSLAENSLGTDLKNYRSEFLSLVKRAKRLQK